MHNRRYSADEVGTAFVKHYYDILHHNPEVAVGHYARWSVISRPRSDGVMESADTLKGIEDLIRSLDYKEYTVDIITTDSQKSYRRGVSVLVTGYLIGKHYFRKKFVQSFFLAPQKNGYYVQSDVFRFVDDGDSSEIPPGTQFDGVTINSNPDHGEPVDTETASHSNDAFVDTESALTKTLTYAQMVKVEKDSPRIAMTNTVEEARESGLPVQAPSINRNEVKRNGIYVRNLACSTTETQLEMIFKKFGAIIPGGVTLINHPEQGYCYAFVYFESQGAVKAAIQASSIFIQGRRAHIKFKGNPAHFSGHGSSGYQQWRRV